ncbi:indolepyruvate ferredoxin oxidoreductase family protein [Nocardia sp. alder85J]|uniref:indolepyruvate ferredoxin oxidoreductase family protein n=1 Tax=Nocardia sp. alder85J TaxID=2862949 RepID=UPI001CD6BAFC|nr:indolepyruvate ferredoxin oxidoreductase family protein [Nocardia sp. alder85J]MCX4092571.1 indolepyruvate ferredoxin oxidoreductase family protein [Nocardia sp. alder85J]
MTITERTTTEVILSGAETLVRLLILRHRLDELDGLTTATMVSGYPGSPLGGVDLALEQRPAELAEHRIVHRPGLNEELAAATVWGSQMGAVVPYEDIDGVAGAWYGKGPGLDRCGDAMKHANAMGAGPNGGVVMFCGDDPGSKSSTLACDSQYTFADACMPVLYPGDQQEVLDLGVHAFRMSRLAGSWVGLKMVTAVADGVGTVDLDAGRHESGLTGPLFVDGQPWTHQPLAKIGPHAVPDQEVLVTDRRLRAAQAYARQHELDRVSGAAPGARLGVVCAGKTYFDVLQAFSDLGYDDPADAGVRVLKLAMTFPLVEETAVEFAASVDRIVVIEEKRPFVEQQLRALLHEAGSSVPVAGKRDASRRPLISAVGELDPAAIGKALTRLLPDLAPAAAPGTSGLRIDLPLLAIPPRAPAFCSGCPHNRSTVAPDGALVGGGVGCHGMVYFEARHQDTRALPPTPMGAEGVPWIGLSPFVSEPHLIQNLGDGTLSHSGTLAIRAAVAANANLTFKILYNAAVAMTGGQDVTGLLDVPAMTRALQAEGVRKVVVCAEEPHRYGRRARWAPGVEVLHRSKLPQVQEQLREVPGVTVVIYDQRCAAEARRLRKRGELPTPPQRVVINQAVCEGCGDCATKSNCLSVLPVETEFGIKRQIHDPSCNRDYTCLEGDCPSFVTITPRASRWPSWWPSRQRRTAPARPALPAGDLPDPRIAELDTVFGIYFTGIGGTGVVTAARILAHAAEAGGLVIGGLDQTGLSQKAGPVVSHLRLAKNRDALRASAVGVAGADLYLSGDILQAASPSHLGKVGPGRTRAVVDRAVTPTPTMLQAGTAAPDLASLEAAIVAQVGAERTVLLDTDDLAARVFADNLLANVILLGAAFQAGALPLSAADLEAAIARQGRAAKSNRAAFEWGRWAVHDPAAVAATLAEHDAAQGVRDINDPTAAAAVTAAALVGARSLPEPLRPLLTRRAAQAIDYQNASRAERYLDLVARTAAADDAGHDWELTRAVAESYFRVLAYKDEYEVARLHLAADYDRIARDLGIEGAYSVKYQLHPPMLRLFGRESKLPMGKPYEWSFRALRRMKGLRGTALDFWGLHPDRGAERRLIGEYERLLDEAVLGEPAADYAHRVELAASVLDVKGYAGIKDRSIERWRERVTELRQAGAGAPV